MKWARLQLAVLATDCFSISASAEGSATTFRYNNLQVSLSEPSAEIRKCLIRVRQEARGPDS